MTFSVRVSVAVAAVCLAPGQVSAQPEIDLAKQDSTKQVSAAVLQAEVRDASPLQKAETVKALDDQQALLRALQVKVTQQEKTKQITAAVAAENFLRIADAAQAVAGAKAIVTGTDATAPPPSPEQLQQQTEVLRFVRRPVMALCKGAPWSAAITSEWSGALTKQKDLIAKYSSAVGLVTAYDVLDDSSLRRRQEVGTAIVVGPRAVVTNKHVVKEAWLGYQDVSTKAWQLFPKVTAEIEFPHEYARCPSQPASTRKARIVGVLYAPPEADADFIVLETDVDLPTPVPFADKPDVVDSDRIAVIGYPGRPNIDFIQPDQIDSIFGTPDSRVPFPIARISLGYTLSGAPLDRFFYDATTWGGSSGSLVIDLVSGDVIALHADGLNAPKEGIGYNRGVTAGQIAAWQKTATKRAAQ